VTTAGALWLQGVNRADVQVLANVPSGWRNARLPRQNTSLRFANHVIEVKYRSRRDGSFDVGEASIARVHHWDDRGIDVEVDGRRAHSRVTRSGDVLFVQATRGTAVLEIVPRFVVPGVELVHGGLSAPMPGVIIDVRVALGQEVTAGETLVVMEAMKMEHIISAPSSGTVTELFVTIGQQVDSEAVLLTIDTGDDESTES
jgi:propionyl-CoA carboxylase alpha chain